jgi:cytochrome c-type biogenesis protein CcmH
VRTLGALLMLVAATAAAAAETPEQEARYHALVAELRCMVCQNQSIAESNAGLAEDLRRQVRDQIAAGRSDEEILEFMTTRYGDYVRYRPAFKPQTLLPWLGPFALLALAAFVAARHVRRSRATQAVAIDEQQLRRVLEDEGGKPQ